MRVDRPTMRTPEIHVFGVLFNNIPLTPLRKLDLSI